jgi:D-alanine-D-alanine ligase
MRIALITDPRGRDYPVSIQDTYYESLLHVAENIAEAILGLGHQFEHFVADHNLHDELVRFDPNLVFNRSNRENSDRRFAFTPHLLDDLGISYTGPNAQNCVTAYNKYLTKKILQNLEIPTPRFAFVDNPKDIQIPDNLSFPLLVKPVTGGSSLGIEGENLVFRKDSCQIICSNLIKNFDRPVIVEEFLIGREFTVGILGNKPPKALPILEFIHFSNGDYHFRSFTSKMVLSKYEKKSCPALISKQQEKEITDLALKAYEAVGCRDYARIDIRFDENNTPHVLEVNAFPSLVSDGSSFALMASAAGLSFLTLIEKILDIAIERNISR